MSLPPARRVSQSDCFCRQSREYARQPLKSMIKENAVGTKISLTAADGFNLGAYRADPQGTPKAVLVLIQEIFGVNRHIRTMCDRFASRGYLTIAPQVFDRYRRDFECGYTAEEVAEARKITPGIDWAAMLRDVAATITAAKSAGPVGIVGYCMGGTVAFLAAAKLDGLSSAVCYYGGMIAKNADEKPKVPTQMHFGEKDEHIPMSDVDTILKRRPECEVYVYPAGHGFSCDERASFHEPSAKLAMQRTLAWFGETLKA
jgi:carboxymethylenebutenolidase